MTPVPRGYYRRERGEGAFFHSEGFSHQGGAVLSTVSDHMFFKKMEIQIAFLCENHGSTGGKKSPDFELSPSILRFKTKVYDFRIQRDFLGRDLSVNNFRCRSSTIYSRPK